MGRFTVVALLALLLASGSAAEEAGPPDIAATTQRLLHELNAVERSCGESPGIDGYQADPICAHFDGNVKALRKKLRDACPGGFKSENGILLEQRKSPDGSLFAAKLLAESRLLLDLFFEPASGRVILVQPPSCLGLPPGRVPDFVVQQLENGPRREVVRKIHPEFPEPARRDKVGGLVVLDYVIETDGSVGQVCVVHVAPEGLAFELEAQAALKRWIYSPAPQDADPAGQEARMVTTFWLQ